MAGLTRKDIDAAVTDALKGLAVTGGGYVRTLAGYRGGLDAASLGKEAVRLPAVYVSYTGATYAAGPALGRIETLLFTIITVSAVTPGFDRYRLQDDVREELDGSILGDGVRPVRLVREYPLGVTAGSEMLAAEYAVERVVGLTAQT